MPAQEHAQDQRQRQALEACELGADHQAARDGVEDVAEHDREPRALAGLGLVQQFVLVAAAQMLEALAGEACPYGGIELGRSGGWRRPHVAELAHLLVEERIFGQQAVEVGLADHQQVAVDLGADRRRARAAAQQRHLAERLAGAQLRHRMAGLVVQHLDGAAGDDVERVTGVAEAEDRLVRVDLVLPDPIEQGLDLLGRQVGSRLHCDSARSFSLASLRLRFSAYSMKRDG